ncbi:XkdW family protein [Clostridium sporogenes]
MEILKEYIKDNMIIREISMDGKTVSHIVHTPIEKETEGEVIELPKNPILELQKQVDTLGQELTKSKIENVKKDSIINTLGKELAQIKIQLAGGNK